MIGWSRGSSALAAVTFALVSTACDTAPSESPNTVRAVVQLRPGGPVEEFEMEVHEAPVDLPTVAAGAVELEEDELVIGVVVDGHAVAYPVRYLALSEVVNDRVGDTPIAPSW